MIKLISISLISTKSITNSSSNMPVVTRSAYNVRRDAMTHMRIIEENCRLEQMCAICHDEIRGSDVFHLPCGHTFHKACLINQLRHGRQWATKCAVCRADHTEALLQNSETAPYVHQHSSDNLEVVFTMMVPIRGNNGLGGEQPPFWGVWNANEGDDASNMPNPNIIMDMLTEYIENDDDGGVEPNASDASMEVDEVNAQEEDQESDLSAPDYEYNLNDEYEDDDLDSESYHYGPRTWTGTFYTIAYPANVHVESSENVETDSTNNETISSESVSI